jgi:precorrin-4/cobalt-precorrin-4 C11-methyltransferase
MKVYFVGAGPGDPELLTIKAAKLVRASKMCIYAGSLVSPAVISLLPAQAEKHDSSKLNLDEIAALFQSAQERGLDVVRLHTGDPAIYGAIREQMRELDRLGIDYEVVPGISSFQAAAAVLRAELTLPEVSQTVILTRAAGRTPIPERQSLRELARSRATLCIFLSARKIEEIASELAESYGWKCPAALVHRATWPDQQVIRGTLADIAAKTTAAGITRTAVILVGHALGDLKAVSKLYDSAFSHEFRQGQIR